MSRESIDFHKKVVNQVIETLAETNTIKYSKATRVDFVLDGKKTRVNAHRLAGTTKKYIVMEYCNDWGTDMALKIESEIFVIPGENEFYQIDKEELYNQVNTGIQRDRNNFKITNTGDVLKNSGLCISIEFDTFKRMNGIKKFNFKK